MGAVVQVQVFCTVLCLLLGWLSLVGALAVQVQVFCIALPPSLTAVLEP